MIVGAFFGVAKIAVGNGLPDILPFDLILEIELDDEVRAIGAFHLDDADGLDFDRRLRKFLDCQEDIGDMAFIGFRDIGEIVEKTFLNNKKPFVGEDS